MAHRHGRLARGCIRLADPACIAAHGHPGHGPGVSLPGAVLDVPPRSPGPGRRDAAPLPDTAVVQWRADHQLVRPRDIRRARILTPAMVDACLHPRGPAPGPWRVADCG